MMWGDTNSPYSGFSDGIRDVSVRFAASIFVGAFATQPFQKDTAEWLYRTAIDNLQRIIDLQQKATAIAALTKTDAALDLARFYFQPAYIQVADPIEVSFFIPNFVSNSNWVLVREYLPGTYIHTRQIAADIAFAINTYTLDPLNRTNLIAAVNQAGDQEYPYIDFCMRSMVVGFISELISIRIQYTNNPTQLLPFTWGLLLSDLKPYAINSQILILKNPKESTLTALTVDTSNRTGRTVLYFRASPTVTIPTGDLTYRVSVTEDLIETATIVPSTAPRYSQAALALVNALHNQRAKTKLLGSLIQNDPASTIGGVAGVDLLAWRATNPETKLVLDVLSIPTDLEIALGDETGPHIDFTTNPLTALVSPNFQKSIPASNSGTSAGEGCYVVQVGGNNANQSLAERTKEISRRITGHLYG
jgi:hypothetical protein